MFLSTVVIKKTITSKFTKANNLYTVESNNSLFESIVTVLLKTLCTKVINIKLYFNEKINTLINTFIAIGKVASEEHYDIDTQCSDSLRNY